MNIVHISDLHFGNTENVYVTSALKDAFLELIATLGVSDLVLVISGDITFRGSEKGFKDANIFFNYIISHSKIDKTRILVCSGNHDICKDDKGNSSFNSLNNFIYSLRRDHKLDVIKSNFSLLPIDDMCFLVINSAYHLDHKFGLIDEEIYKFIENNQSKIDKYKYKIAITHHHLLNQFKDDTSAIRNAYPFLYALDACGFNLILHGHQHTCQNMPIGKSQMLIEAARSFNFPEKGYQNGVNHYYLKNNKLEKDVYEFIKDKIPTKLTLVKL
jgi:DNA repair exonuclease SbcCD nuclease subunit